MRTVRAWLVPTVSVIAARWAQFVAGRPRLGRLVAPIMGSRLDTRPSRPSSAAAGRDRDRYRPVHFPQSGRGRDELARLPRPATDEFDRLVRSARRRDHVTVRPSAVQPPWAADALVALAAAGVPMSWSGEPDGLPEVLGPELAGVLVGPVDDGRRGRELHSIRVRRAALRLIDRADGIVDPPGVSVLLASRRPADIERAVGFVARQRDVRVQLVVGLHGPEWSEDAASRIEVLGPPEMTVVRVGAERSLGHLLAELTRHARHDLITKWDDDDWYGTEHLADLCHAYRYSGADVVGKAAEFVYLEQSDVTVRRFAFGAESYRWTLAGGTLLTSTAWLDHIGGWRPVERGVDRELLDATRRSGGSAYRTHGFQYILHRRDGAVHTWAAPDRSFLATAVETRPGLALREADVEEPA